MLWEKTIVVGKRQKRIMKSQNVFAIERLDLTKNLLYIKTWFALTGLISLPPLEQEKKNTKKLLFLLCGLKTK